MYPGRHGSNLDLPFGFQANQVVGFFGQSIDVLCHIIFERTLCNFVRDITPCALGGHHNLNVSA